MKTGTSGSVSSITAGRDGVDRGDEREHGDRDDDREHDLRQVAGERGLERVDAADGDRRHLGALGAVERRRPVAEPPLDEVEPELREHVRRGAASRDLEPPVGRRARATTAREAQRDADVGERGAVERARGDVRDEDGLGEDEQRGDHAERRVGGEQDAHGPRAAQQARIDRPHGR